MGVAVVNNSWLSQNLNRAYPFVDWVDRADSTGTIVVPDDLLVEAYFPTGPEISIDPARFHLRSLSIYANGIGLQLGYDAGGTSFPVAAASLPRAGFTPYRAVPLTGTGAFAGSIGKVVFGSLAGLDGLPAGRFEFTLADAQLDVDAIRPQLRGVSAIRVVGDGVESTHSGQVTLRFGSNFRFSSPAAGQVRLDAIDGAGLRASCECGGSSEEAPPPITSINGMVGSEFTLVGDPCLSVAAAGSTIALSDGCSAPCCGCAEQESLRAAVDRILEDIRGLDGFTSRLGERVTAVAAVAIGSKVADSGCVECG